MILSYKDFLPYYPDVESDNLQQLILNKKEFSELQLGLQPARPLPNELLESQKIIQRFVSPYTLYDEILLFHGTGTGKTGAAFGITEKLLTDPDMNIKRAFILTSGPDLLDNHIEELVTFFSNGRFQIPEDKTEKPERKLAIMRNLVKKQYVFETFGDFVGSFENKDDNEVIRLFSNCVYVLDEVHSIRAELQARIYRQLDRIFHLIQNRRIILMSATPMTDDVSEIAPIMNLILPRDKQLPIDKSFKKLFIKDETIINQDQLFETFKGRISYLSYRSNISTRYMGETMSPPNIEEFKIYTTRMESIQEKGYIQAYQEDTEQGDAEKEKTSSVYNNSRQAALFVFPDGSYGQKGLVKYADVEKNAINSLNRDLIREVNTIEKLSRFSSKYAFIIQNILDNPKKLIYVYCSLVNGSGINLLSKILELYGFERAHPKVRFPGRRYIRLTSHTNNISRLLEMFNSEKNATGDYCQVILGSKKISEGFNFKNIQIVHITTLFWNYTETQQAIARALRLDSHKNLIKQGILPVVDIYQHGSILTDTPSIDIMMLNLSKQKDILIRKMTRVIKESAFDCPLTFNRNFRQSIAGSRECDYQECDYKCEDSGFNPTITDLSTYQLYYQKDDNVVNAIKEIFQNYFVLELRTLQDLLQVDSFQLLKSLNFVINYNLPITNKYGIVCYLREQNNTYYLVDNIILANNQLNLNYYTTTPNIIQRKSLKELIQEQAFIQGVRGVQELSEATDEKQAESILSGMTLQNQELVIETVLENKYRLNKKSRLDVWIESIYRNVLTKTDDRDSIVVSSLLKPVNRCLSVREGWVDCPTDLRDHEMYQTLARLEDYNKNTFGYYGIVGTETGKFCIKDIRPVAGESADKRLARTGSVCTEVGYKKPRLAEICLELGLDIELDQLDLNARNTVGRNRTKGFETLLERWRDWDDEKFAKGVYFWRKSQKQICELIQQFFQSKGLLVDGVCGKAGKKKE